MTSVRQWTSTSKDLMSAADYLKLFMLFGIAIGIVLNRRLARSSVALRIANKHYVDQTDRMFGLND